MSKNNFYNITKILKLIEDIPEILKLIEDIPEIFLKENHFLNYLYKNKKILNFINKKIDTFVCELCFPYLQDLVLYANFEKNEYDDSFYFEKSKINNKLILEFYIEYAKKIKNINNRIGICNGKNCKNHPHFYDISQNGWCCSCSILLKKEKPDIFNKNISDKIDYMEEKKKNNIIDIDLDYTNIIIQRQISYMYISFIDYLFSNLESYTVANENNESSKNETPQILQNLINNIINSHIFKKMYYEYLKKKNQKLYDSEFVLEKFKNIKNIILYFFTTNDEKIKIFKEYIIKKYEDHISNNPNNFFNINIRDISGIQIDSDDEKKKFFYIISIITLINIFFNYRYIFVNLIKLKKDIEKINYDYLIFLFESQFGENEFRIKKNINKYEFFFENYIKKCITSEKYYEQFDTSCNHFITIKLENVFNNKTNKINFKLLENFEKKKEDEKILFFYKKKNKNPVYVIQQLFKFINLKIIKIYVNSYLTIPTFFEKNKTIEEIKRDKIVTFDFGRYENINEKQKLSNFLLNKIFNEKFDALKSYFNKESLFFLNKDIDKVFQENVTTNELNIFTFKLVFSIMEFIYKKFNTFLVKNPDINSIIYTKNLKVIIKYFFDIKNIDIDKTEDLSYKEKNIITKKWISFLENIRDSELIKNLNLILDLLKKKKQKTFEKIISGINEIELHFIKELVKVMFNDEIKVKKQEDKKQEDKKKTSGGGEVDGWYDSNESFFGESEWTSAIITGTGLATNIVLGADAVKNFYRIGESEDDKKKRMPSYLAYVSENSSEVSEYLKEGKLPNMMYLGGLAIGGLMLILGANELTLMLKEFTQVHKDKFEKIKEKFRQNKGNFEKLFNSNEDGDINLTFEIEKMFYKGQKAIDDIIADKLTFFSLFMSYVTSSESLFKIGADLVKKLIRWAADTFLKTYGYNTKKNQRIAEYGTDILDLLIDSGIELVKEINSDENEDLDIGDLDKMEKDIEKDRNYDENLKGKLTKKIKSEKEITQARKDEKDKASKSKTQRFFEIFFTKFIHYMKDKARQLVKTKFKKVKTKFKGLFGRFAGMSDQSVEHLIQGMSSLLQMPIVQIITTTMGRGLSVAAKFLIDGVLKGTESLNDFFKKKSTYGDSQESKYNLDKINNILKGETDIKDEDLEEILELYYQLVSFIAIGSDNLRQNVTFYSSLQTFYDMEKKMRKFLKEKKKLTDFKEYEEEIAESEENYKKNYNTVVGGYFNGERIAIYTEDFVFEETKYQNSEKVEITGNVGTELAGLFKFSKQLTSNTVTAVTEVAGVIKRGEVTETVTDTLKKAKEGYDKEHDRKGTQLNKWLEHDSPGAKIAKSLGVTKVELTQPDEPPRGSVEELQAGSRKHGKDGKEPTNTKRLGTTRSGKVYQIGDEYEDEPGKEEKEENPAESSERKPPPKKGKEEDKKSNRTTQMISLLSDIFMTVINTIAKQIIPGAINNFVKKNLQAIENQITAFTLSSKLLIISKATDNLEDLKSELKGLADFMKSITEDVNKKIDEKVGNQIKEAVEIIFFFINLLFSIIDLGVTIMETLNNTLGTVNPALQQAFSSFFSTLKKVMSGISNVLKIIKPSIDKIILAEIKFEENMNKQNIIRIINETFEKFETTNFFNIAEKIYNIIQAESYKKYNSTIIVINKHFEKSIDDFNNNSSSIYFFNKVAIFLITALKYSIDTNYEDILKQTDKIKNFLEKLVEFYEESYDSQKYKQTSLLLLKLLEILLKCDLNRTLEIISIVINSVSTFIAFNTSFNVNSDNLEAFEEIYKENLKKIEIVEKLKSSILMFNQGGIYEDSFLNISKMIEDNNNLRNEINNAKRERALAAFKNELEKKKKEADDAAAEDGKKTEEQLKSLKETVELLKKIEEAKKQQLEYDLKYFEEIQKTIEENRKKLEQDFLSQEQAQNIFFEEVQSKLQKRRLEEFINNSNNEKIQSLGKKFLNDQDKNNKRLNELNKFSSDKMSEKNLKIFKIIQDLMTPFKGNVTKSDIEEIKELLKIKLNTDFLSAELELQLDSYNTNEKDYVKINRILNLAAEKYKKKNTKNENELKNYDETINNIINLNITFISDSEIIDENFKKLLMGDKDFDETQVDLKNMDIVNVSTCNEFLSLAIENCEGNESSDDCDPEKIRKMKNLKITAENILFEFSAKNSINHYNTFNDLKKKAILLYDSGKKVFESGKKIIKDLIDGKNYALEVYNLSKIDKEISEIEATFFSKGNVNLEELDKLITLRQNRRIKSLGLKSVENKLDITDFEYEKVIIKVMSYIAGIYVIGKSGHRPFEKGDVMNWINGTIDEKLRRKIITMRPEHRKIFYDTVKAFSTKEKLSQLMKFGKVGLKVSGDVIDNATQIRNEGNRSAQILANGNQKRRDTGNVSSIVESGQKSENSSGTKVRYTDSTIGGP